MNLKYSLCIVLATATAFVTLPSLSQPDSGDKVKFTSQQMSDRKSGEKIPVIDAEISQNLQDAEAYYNQGNLYFDQQQWKKALSDYTKAIAISPQFANAYNNRGLVYAKQKHWKKALSDYTKAIAINPQYANAYVGRGIVYAEQKQWQKAESDLNKAIAINPQLALAYYNRGVLYFRLGNKQKAISNFQQAQKLFIVQGDSASSEKVARVLAQLRN
jgi:tetratricopeptide (TPR) repeat protein